MDADFSIELGRNDPMLDFPWSDVSGKFTYIDLKRRPDLMARVEEAEKFSELGKFLGALNTARSIVETAKCDVWATTELCAEEEIYGARHKFASYVDVVFRNIDARLSSLGLLPLRQSFPAHERFARKLVELLRRAPEIRSSAEVCVRRCFFEEDGSVQEGFYCTLYVHGYGNDEASARRGWGNGLKLMENAIAQLAAGGME